MPVDCGDLECLRVLILGAALVDYTIEVPQSLLLKHNLEKNAIYNLSISPELRTAVKEALDINPEKVLKTPGGTASNTARFFRWLEKQQGQKLKITEAGNSVDSLVNFIGVVGADEDADWLKRVANQEKLRCAWVINKSEVTGKCFALICGTNRCLISEGGANDFDQERFFSQQIQNILSQSDCLYTSAYLFLHESSFASVLEIASSFRKNSKLVFVNLASHKAFQNEMFAKRVKQVLSLCDFVIGNDSEFAALFGEELAVNSSTIEKTVLKFLETESISFKILTFVITKGALETIVVRIERSPNGDPVITVQSFEVDEIPSDQIKDTSGAGDAFMAGFLFGVSRKLEMSQVIKLAHDTASFCIGCTGASINNI